VQPLSELWFSCGQSAPVPGEQAAGCVADADSWSPWVYHGRNDVAADAQVIHQTQIILQLFKSSDKRFGCC